MTLDGLSAMAARLRGIFCDIDDTLTHAGALVPAAYERLVAAKSAGLRVVPVTGRPAGWAAVLAATWPVDAVVAENGACWFVGGKPQFWQTDAERALAKPRLEAVRRDVLEHVPGARLAEDQWLRLCDVAFDIGETQQLAPETVAEIKKRIEAAGMRAVISTVHAHAMAGNWDKAAALRVLTAGLWGEELDVTRGDYLFVGDSPNDQACFAYFPVSAGVANAKKFALDPPPVFFAANEGGFGFAEIVDMVLASRPASSPAPH